jgi:hypothetical protein
MAGNGSLARRSCQVQLQFRVTGLAIGDVSSMTISAPGDFSSVLSHRLFGGTRDRLDLFSCQSSDLLFECIRQISHGIVPHPGGMCQS